MRKSSARSVAVVAVAVTAVAALVVACGGKDEAPPAQMPVNAAVYPQQGYPQPQAAQQAPAAQTAVAPTAAPAPGAMAVPGPLAFPCSNDSTCGTHHCNTQYGKCAFPCQSDTDCIMNTRCIAGPGICGPKP